MWYAARLSRASCRGIRQETAPGEHVRLCACGPTQARNQAARACGGTDVVRGCNTAAWSPDHDERRAGIEIDCGICQPNWPSILLTEFATRSSPADSHPGHTSDRHPPTHPHPAPTQHYLHNSNNNNSNNSNHYSWQQEKPIAIVLTRRRNFSQHSLSKRFRALATPCRSSCVR